MTHLSNFEHSKNFLQKTDSATFTCLLSPSFMQKIEKNRRAQTCRDNGIQRIFWLSQGSILTKQEGTRTMFIID